MESMMSARQVAELLGVHESWVYEQAVGGGLPSYKLGGTRRFRRDEIDGWIEEHRERGGRSAAGGGPPRPDADGVPARPAAQAVRVAMARVEAYRLRNGSKRYRARWLAPTARRNRAPSSSRRTRSGSSRSSSAERSLYQAPPARRARSIIDREPPEASITL